MDMKYVGVDGRIILKRILKESNGRAWTGLIWLRAVKSNGRSQF
jgi:hypothetical protein